LATKPRPPLGEKSVRWLGVLVFLAGLVLSFGLDHMTNRKSSPYFAELYGEDFQILIPYSFSDCPFEVKATISQSKREASKTIPAFWFLASDNSKILLNGGLYYREGDQIIEERGDFLKFTKNLFRIDCSVAGEIKFKIKMSSTNIDPRYLAIHTVKNAIYIPPLVKTIGTIGLWLGAAMFVLGLRRRNRVAVDASPAPSKWGRGN
jgi:hypothetical protein